MTAAYKRVTELLDRWQASVDLHARYLALDDEAYAKVQAWPKHERPTRWVLELARTRLTEIRSELTLREESGDPTFAEALELMGLLSNLLGAEHIERFVPLATGKAQTAVSGTVRRPRLKQSEARTAGTRSAATPQAPRAAAKAAPRAAAAPAQRSTASTSSPAAKAAPSAPVSNKVVATVVSDAVRFLGWGREWPALAPSIARLADRPPEAEIARILREHRAVIEQKARRPAP